MFSISLFVKAIIQSNLACSVVAIDVFSTERRNTVKKLLSNKRNGRLRALEAMLHLCAHLQLTIIAFGLNMVELVAPIRCHDPVKNQCNRYTSNSESIVKYLHNLCPSAFSISNHCPLLDMIDSSGVNVLKSVLSVCC